MKHIKTFENFLNEESSSNLNEGLSFDEMKDKYKDNPYGIGAQSVEYVEAANGNPARLIFRHDERSRRDQIESKLKSMGIPAKKLSKSTADKAFVYRYELYMYENEDFMNEAVSVAPMDWFRMSNLTSKADDGSSVAKLITNKNKAMTRFVAGLKLSNSPLNYNDAQKEYTGNFSALGNLAIKLGATSNEISVLYDKTELPPSYAK